MNKPLTIQQAAEASGLSVHTLRYYERIGLIDRVARQANRHRLYHEADMRWIEFLCKLRTTGLPIQQMLRYAELRRQGDHAESIAERRAILADHARSIEAALVEMQQTLSVLHGKLTMYDEIERQLATQSQAAPASTVCAATKTTPEVDTDESDS